ncbi:MAG: class I SAM-dependent methyltransferase [Patescibacteria group bacterium]
MICPSCQSPNARRWISCQDRLRNKPLDHHAYYRCLTCGLTFLHPQTTSQSYDQHYDAQYLSHVAERPRVPSDTARRLRLMQERERAWEQNPSFFSRLFRRTGFFRHTPFKMLGHGKRLLDVGSGAGTFLLTQQHLGWNVSGLEPSQSMVEQSRSWGLDVRQGFSIAEQWKEPTFDVVVLNQVFEHLTDPRQILRDARQALTQGGILYLNMPTNQSVVAQVFRSFWFNLDAPRHNLLFSPSTLRTLLQEEGFEVLDLYTASSTKGWTGSIEYFLRDALHVPLVDGRLRRHHLLNLLLKPLVRLLDWIGYGDNLHVIAKTEL